MHMTSAAVGIKLVPATCVLPPGRRQIPSRTASGNPSRAQSIISTANFAARRQEGKKYKKKCAAWSLEENPKQTEKKLWIFTPFAIKMPTLRARLDDID